MIPGLGGMNPAQMKAMMRQLGIQSEDLEAKKAVIELTNGTKIIFDSPNVTAVNMKGSKTYTITGESREETGSGKEEIPAEDVEMVLSQCGCTEEEARAALDASEGDIAEAIAALKK